MIIGYTKRGKTPHLVNLYLDPKKTLCGRKVDIREPWNKDPQPDLCRGCLRRSERDL